MCEFDLKSGDTRIDPCMIHILKHIEGKVVACCCGHGKYPMTIIKHVEFHLEGHHFVEIVSGKKIPRKKRFYKRDNKGIYYIPEVLENIK